MRDSNVSQTKLSSSDLKSSFPAPPPLPPKLDITDARRHPMAKPDDGEDALGAIALLQQLGITRFSRPSRNKLQIGRITYRTDTGSIFIDGAREPHPQCEGLTWLQTFIEELGWVFSPIARDDDSPEMRDAIAYVEEYALLARRVGDEILIGRLTFQPNSGLIFIDKRRDAPAAHKGLDGLKALIQEVGL
jgi:hypothetical protein